MSQLILTRNMRLSGSSARRSVSDEVAVSPFFLMVILVLFIAFSCVAYLVNSNQVSMKGYEIKRLDDQHRALLDRNERAHNYLSELTSMASMKNSGLARNMVKPGDVTFVRSESTVALSEH